MDVNSNESGYLNRAPASGAIEKCFFLPNRLSFLNVNISPSAAPLTPPGCRRASFGTGEPEVRAWKPPSGMATTNGVSLVGR